MKPIVILPSVNLSLSSFLPPVRALLANAPLFAQLLARLPKIQNDELGAPIALAWQDRPIIYYQPQSLKALSHYEHWLTAWLGEELLHLLLQHPRLQNTYPVAWAFHLAADLEVRQYWCFGEEDFSYQPLLARLHLPDNASLDTIYQALLRLQVTVGAQEVLPGWTASPLSRLSHHTWPSLSFSAADWQAWWYEQHDLQEEFKQGPQGLLLRNLKANSPVTAQLPWPTLLSRFITSAQRTQHRNSLRRPSRRFGTMPGMRRRRTAKLAVILDTSGSIKEENRQRFFAELQMLKRFTSEIIVIEADYKIQQTYHLTEAIPVYSQGGGATSFNAALQYVNTAGPFDGVIYLTDAEGPRPTIRCLYPLLWLVVGHRGRFLPANWPGQIVYWEGA